MNKKKICLVIPPSPFLLDERVFPFLGLLKVASAWEALNERVLVLDLSGIENYLDVVQEYFETNAKDVEFVGVSATTPQMPFAFNIASKIKSICPMKLVLGGAHVTLMHTATKVELKKGAFGRACEDIDKIKSVFDVLVCGDGELTLQAIRNTNKGVVDVDDKKSEFFLTDSLFSELPAPARHLIDLDSYKYYIEGERATSIIGQLGCPFVVRSVAADLVRIYV